MKFPLVLVVLVFLLYPTAVMGQETPAPEAGPESVSYLPEASAFGEGWTQTDSSGIEVPSDIFREGSRGVYGGPNGARVSVIVLLTTDSRVAVRQSWEEATDRFDAYRYALAEQYDYSQVERLEALEPPEGCVEAKRAEGQDSRFGYTAGITMCAIDPDVVLLAAASGDVADEAGFRASDAVIAAAIAANGA